MEKIINAHVIVDSNGSEDLWLQIYDNHKLVYAHEYLRDGATDAKYKRIMAEVKSDAEACENYADFEGNDKDDDGNVYDVWDSGYFCVAEYCPESGWQSEYLDDDLDLIASDILIAVGLNIDKF